jgi:hypothetical protein
MADPSAKLMKPKAVASFVHEASIRLGISEDRLTTAVRASQALSKDELEVVVSLVDFAQTGAPLKKRSAVSRGLVRAIRTMRETKDGPLIEVDDPMDAAEAAEEVARAETEIQAHRETFLKECVSADEAAEAAGRSRQALERLRRANRLLALRVGNQWRYPRWQFEPDAPGGILPGLEDVLSRLHLSPPGAAFWLFRPNDQLEGSPPIELLRRRHPEPVVQLAWEYSLMP